MRRAIAILSLGVALGTAVTSCEGDPAGIEILEGRFLLESVDGEPLPFVIMRGPPNRATGEPSDCFYLVTSGHLELDPDGGVFRMLVVREWRDEDGETCLQDLLVPVAETGSYEQRGNRLLLRFGPGEEPREARIETGRVILKHDRLVLRFRLP